MTRATCGAIPSSLPTPFCTEATAPSANACAVAAIAASVCIAFVATIPNSHGGSSAASVVARIPVACTSPAPVSRSPFALIASTCSRARSYAHTSTSSSEARLAANSDPTAPQPTMQTLTPALRSRSSRPPVSPDGRRISIRAISAPSMTSRDPSGRSSVKPTPIPSSAFPSTESRPLTASAPTTAPQRLVIPPTTSIASVRNVSSR